jgi:hypothetical protein
MGRTSGGCSRHEVANPQERHDQLRAHRRQFVIGPEPVLVDEDWTSVTIGNGFHLSHHRALPVAALGDREGRAWYLLGIAVQTDPARAAPHEEIPTARSKEVDALPFTWSGRWVLLGDGTLRTDSSGLLGCFYTRNPSDGTLIVSSSAALLRNQIGEGDPSPPLRYLKGMSWYPPPASRFAGIRQLLPSQILAYSDEHHPVRYRALISQRLETGHDETLAHLETSLRTALRNLAGTGRPLVLGLTGGYDTRVLLAAMWRERLDFAMFTWDIPGTSRADRVLPPLLARDVGRPHRFIKRQHFNEEHLRTLDEHTALHTVDRDRELIPWGQYAELAGTTVIAGNLFALGALYFHMRLPAHPNAAAESIEHAFSFAEHHTDSPAHRDGIREWAEWIKTHPEPTMDWRDRFFWEQWGSGWGAGCEQAADLVDFECVSPVNCESIMAAILRIDPVKRYGKRWQVDLTYRMAPFLTDHPYHLGGPLVARFRSGASGWVHHPNKRRFATGRMRSLAAQMRAPAAGSPN